MDVFISLFKKYLFHYLAAPSLGCSMQDLVRTLHWESGGSLPFEPPEKPTLESISKNVMTQHTTTRLSLLKLQLYVGYNTKTHDSGSHYGSVMASEAAKKRRELRCCLSHWDIGLEQPFSIWVP